MPGPGTTTVTVAVLVPLKFPGLLEQLTELVEAEINFLGAQPLIIACVLICQFLYFVLAQVDSLSHKEITQTIKSDCEAS